MNAHVFRVLAAGALACLLGGCTGSLLTTKLPVVDTYVLRPAAAGKQAQAALANTVDLAVSEGVAAPGLNTERIAVVHAERRLDYYINVQWGAPVPQVAQSLLVGSLQNQNWFRSVSTEQARVNSNYWLNLEVRDFQAEYTDSNAAPAARVTLVGSLLRISDRKLLAVLPVTVTVTAGANRLAEVVAAFESAAQQAALTLGQQALATLTADKSVER
jgi:cholesterol transport system auxiliary component